MEIPKRTKKCPDCEGELNRIRMLDATEPTGFHVTQAYARIDAKPSMIQKKVKASGDVVGYLCSGCSRIFLYGERRRLG